jgi:hypothetical protein
VAVLADAQEREIEPRGRADDARQLCGVVGRRRREVGRRGRHRVAPGGRHRRGIEPQAAREAEVGGRIVGRDGALVGPEDVDARPVQPLRSQAREEGLGHRAAADRDREAAARGARALGLGGAPPGEGRGEDLGFADENLE